MQFQLIPTLQDKSEEDLASCAESLAETLLSSIPGQMLNYKVTKEMDTVVFEPSTNEMLGITKDKVVKERAKKVTVQHQVNKLNASMLAFSEDF